MSQQGVATTVAGPGGAETGGARTRPKDLRTYLEGLLVQDPEQFVVVEREVDSVFEVTGIVERIGRDARYPKFPAVLFRRIKSSDIPLLINLHGSYERLAFSIDSNVRTMVEEFSRRETHPIPTRRVERSQAPVKEVVWTGDDADLTRLPVLQHQELDGGKFVDSGFAVTRDPDSGVLNGGTYRMQLFGPRELGIQTSSYQSARHIMRRHQEQQSLMPIAVAIGHHPALLLAASTKPPGIGGELEIAGGLLQQPLEVVPAETVDLDVPARAEIIIEGLIDPNPETYRHEGPFGEYPRYYTGSGPQPWIRVTAITMRRNPIYVDVMSAHDEHLAIGGLARVGYMLNRLRDVVPTVTNVHLPISGVARLHAYISMKKHADGEPHLAAFAAFACNPTLKLIILVDDDIDVTNEAEVLWAMATRFQADKDMVTINNSIGGWLNPPTYGYRRDEKGSLETKLIFDCTRPAPPAKFPVRTRVPQDVVERMDPQRYTRPLGDGEERYIRGE